MAGASGSISVNLFGHDRTLSKTFQQAWRGADTFSKKMALVGARMTSIGKQMTWGVTVPIVAGFAVATKAAIAEEKEMALLEQTLRNTTKATDEQVASVERWITATQNATGVADGELRPAMSTLLTATKDVAKAQDLMGVALDIAVSKGKPVATVATAMMEAYNGNIGALGRLGVKTKDATGKVLTFKEVMAEAREVFGGSAAAAAETTAGKFAIFAAKMKDMAEAIGSALIPVIEDLMDIVGPVIERFSQLSDSHRKLIVIVGLVVAAIGPLLMILGQILMVAPAIGAAFAAMTGPVGLVIAAIAALVAGLILLYKKNKTFRDFVQGAWAIICASVGQARAVIGWVIDKFGDLWAWIKRNKKPIITALKAAFAPIAGAWTAAKQVIDWLGQVLGWVQGNWGSIAKFLRLAFAPIYVAYQGAKRLYDMLASAKTISGNMSSPRKAGGGGGSGGGVGAEGGIYTGPRRLLIGEAGAEALIPLTKPNRAAQVLAQAGLLGGGGATTVNVYLDGKLIETHVTKRQQANARRSARTWGYAT